MSKPTHHAYIVETLPEGSERKPRWHKNGSGFDLVIPEGLAVAGRIVCVTPRDTKPA